MKLSELLDNVGQPFSYYPSLVGSLGISVNSCIFLCFLAWRTLPNSDGWRRLSQDDISSGTGLSRRCQESARKELKLLGFLEENYKRLDHQMLYRITDRDIPDCTKRTFATAPNVHSSIIGNKGYKESTAELQFATFGKVELEGSDPESLGAPSSPSDVADAPPKNCRCGKNLPSKGKGKPRNANSWHPDGELLRDQWRRAFEDFFGIPYAESPRDKAAINQLLNSTHLPPLQLIEIARSAWANSSFICLRARNIGGFYANFNDIRAQLARPSRPANTKPTAAEIRNSRISGGDLVRKRILEEQREIEDPNRKLPFVK